MILNASYITLGLIVWWTKKGMNNYAKKKEKRCHPSRWQQLADVQYVDLSLGLVFVWFLFSSLHRARCWCEHVKLNSRVANTQPGHQMLMVAPMHMKNLIDQIRRKCLWGRYSFGKFTYNRPCATAIISRPSWDLLSAITHLTRRKYLTFFSIFLNVKDNITDAWRPTCLFPHCQIIRSKEEE